MTYLTPGFWEHCPKRREKAEKKSQQHDQIYVTANRKIDFEILQAEKNVHAKESLFKNARFNLWKAQKGFM